MAPMDDVPMVEGPGTLELASFGEVLYAFSALRSRSGRRRGGRMEGEMLPWQNLIPDAAPEFALPPSAPPPPPAPRRAEPLHPPRTAKPRRNSSRCQCGECRTCQENARWERIFREKFASPDYYRHEIRVRYASPLSGI
jgi:hypothetical protein